MYLCTHTHIYVYTYGHSRFPPAAWLIHPVCPAAGSWIPVCPVAGFWTLEPPGHSPAPGWVHAVWSWLAGATLLPGSSAHAPADLALQRNPDVHTHRAGGTPPSPRSFVKLQAHTGSVYSFLDAFPWIPTCSMKLESTLLLALAFSCAKIF